MNATIFFTFECENPLELLNFIRESELKATPDEELKIWWAAKNYIVATLREQPLAAIVADDECYIEYDMDYRGEPSLVEHVFVDGYDDIYVHVAGSVVNFENLDLMSVITLACYTRKVEEDLLSDE